MNSALKYQLKPTNSQAKELNRIFAIARKTWNKSLEVYNSLPQKMDSKEKYKLIRNACREYRADEGWMKTRSTRYQDFLHQDLNAAWGKFFKALKEGKVQEARAKYRADYELKKHTGMKWRQKKFESFYKPKFKRAGDRHSFQADKKGSADFDFERGLVWFHKKEAPIKFKIKIKDKFFNLDVKKIGTITFSRETSGKYYVSFCFEQNLKPVPVEVKSGVGIDLGAKTYITLSDGVKIDSVDHSRIDYQIERLQKKASLMYQINKDRKDWRRRNYYKIQRKIGKLRRRKANINQHNRHTLTTALVSNYDLIAIEDLNVKGMTGASKAKLGEDEKTFVRNNKNQKAGLNKKILNNSFYETRRQLEYKAKWSGKKVVQVDRFFPSSKTCSSCGYHNKKVVLGVSEWECPQCATKHDRDINASINIIMEALRQEGFKTPVSKQNACKPSRKKTMVSSIKGLNLVIRGRRQNFNLDNSIELLTGLKNSTLRIEQNGVEIQHCST